LQTSLYNNLLNYVRAGILSIDFFERMIFSDDSDGKYSVNPWSTVEMTASRQNIQNTAGLPNIYSEVMFFT